MTKLISNFEQAFITDIKVSMIDNILSGGAISRTCSAEQFAQAIRVGGKSKEKIEQLRIIDRQADEDAYRKLKETLPAFTLSNFKDGKVINDNFLSSRAMPFDADHLSLDQIEDAKTKLESDPNVFLYFLSPGSEGLKFWALVELITDDSEYRRKYAAIKAYYEVKLGIELDKACSDPRRLTFVSYDPECCYKPFPIPFRDFPELEQKKTNRTAPAIGFLPIPGNNEEANINEALKHISPDSSYQDWLNVGMALHAWNSSIGFSIWDSWSKGSSKYKAGVCENHWKTFKSGGGVTIATLFDYAQKAGYKQQSRKAEYRSQEQQSTPKQEQSEVWEKPLPFSNHNHIGDDSFPLDILPNPLLNMADGLIRTMNIPASMAGSLMLSVISIALRKKYRVFIKDDHIQYGNLDLMLVVPVAGSKTPAIKACMPAFLDKQKEYAEMFQEELHNFYAVEKTYNHEISKIEKGKDDIETKTRKIIDFRKRIGERPTEKSLLCSNTSSEALERKLFENGESIGIICSEGRTVLEIIKGKYNSTGGTDCGVWLSGHAGDYIKIDRIGRKSFELFHPIMAALLALQPDALEAAGECPGLRHSGFLARWVYVCCDVRHSDYPSENIPLSIKDSFNGLLKKLINLSDEIERDVRLSGEAFSLWKQYHDQLKRVILANQLTISPMLIDCLNKLPEHIARLALILHVADCLANNVDSYTIEAGTMRNAIIAGDYYRKHIEKAVSTIGENETIVLGRKLWQWLHSKRQWLRSQRDIEGLGSIEAMKPKDIQQQEVCGLKEIDKLKPIIELLVQYGYLRHTEKAVKENSKKHSIYVLIPEEVVR